MINNRRNFLKKSLALSGWCLATISGLLVPIIAQAKWSAEKYARTSLDETLSKILGNQKPSTSDKIHIKIPEIAENGAIVPITIRSELNDTQSISIVAEKNPVPLIAQFSFAPEMNKQVTARIKLAETCDVIAIVHANSRYYITRQSVQVTIGGCGD